MFHSFLEIRAIYMFRVDWITVAHPRDLTYAIDSFFLQVSLVSGGTLLVAQLVEALSYKPEGRGFDSRWCHWNFSPT
jgi:hypothetical protein